MGIECTTKADLFSYGKGCWLCQLHACMFLTRTLTSVLSVQDAYCGSL